tara:strand:- start:3536 stop:5086 length:1551 start_codon:yes stop_codon:yes gene_type:complete
MDCAREQEEVRWSFLRDKAQGHFDDLTVQQEAKTTELAKAMPKKAVTRIATMPKEMFNQAVTKVVTKPKSMYKADGTLSVMGTKWNHLLDSMSLPRDTTDPITVEVKPETPSLNSHKWYHLLKSENMPSDTVGPITVVTGYVDGNPNGHAQVKAWLYSLNWVPCTFKHSRDDEGEIKTIEQIRYLKGHDREGELCDSVKRLAKKDPAVDVLDGLTVLTHRLGFFKSMLENCVVDNDGSTWLRAEVGGLTNTLRFKHKKPLANLPAVGKAWGQEIRSCLVAPNRDDQVLCGCDMVSLESTTKKHYMYPHDPDYVNEMSADGFDEHLDLAKHAGAVTQGDIDGYVAGSRPDIKPIRSKFKPANYSAVYGIGKAGLARSTGMSVKEAEFLLEAYWERNWAVKAVAKDVYKKETKDGKMWLKNPVSGFWYSLRYEKDSWSTLNQGTGVYCFDKFLHILRSKGVKLLGNFHDEFISVVERGKESSMDETIKSSVSKLNYQIQLNVRLDVDYSYGDSYAEIH